MTRLVRWTEDARDDARRLDRRTRERIIAALDRLAATEYGDVKRLHGDPVEYRLRVGNWRVRFAYVTEIDPQTQEDIAILLVLRVLPRGRAYRE